MNKQEFLIKLKKGLSGLPDNDIEERLAFYGEMIDDRMEDGLSEEEAVQAVGTVDEIVSQTIADTPFVKLVKERMTVKRKLTVWEILLLALGSPLWLSLLIVAVAVILVIYVCLWTVIISLWAVFVSAAASGVATVAAGIFFAVRGNVLSGIAASGVGFFAAGLSIFIFFGCKAATKGILFLTEKIAFSIKNRFVKKEETK